MRLCKNCNSKMIIKENCSSEQHVYFWVCSTPNCKKIENTILKNQNNSSWRSVVSKFNSMKFLKPSDIVCDSDRHYSICNYFQYGHKFKFSDIENLDITLGFDSVQDFFFWIATQQSIVTHSVHNYFPVGSPYYFTFKELTNTINKNYQNVINSISLNQVADIEKSIKDWKEYFEEQAERKASRFRESQDKLEKEHQLAVERKSEKATIDIFNAIRRKDVKAIIELRKKGADLYHKNENGLNCFEYAKTIGIEIITEALNRDLNENNN